MPNFSAEQQAFLCHDPTRSARLLAGPGTGKSFTSVAYLEKIANDRPELRVNYITFTRAATAEFAKKMQDAGLAALGGRLPQTMHGFALSLLLKYRSSKLPYPLRIIDSWEEKNLIHPDISRELKSKGFTSATPTMVKKLQDEIAAGFNSLDQAPLPLTDGSPALMQAYRGVWAVNRQIYGYSLLSELPYQAGQVLSDLDETEPDHDLLIVDEYQDLNFADQRVLTELAALGVTIVAIGDDDQSIYSWRNAAPDGIRNFLDTFNASRHYKLTLSQRCGGRALAVANSLIELDSKRPAKTRLTSSPTAPDTEVRYLRFRTNTLEAEGVAGIVASRLADGVPPTDIIILARSSVNTWHREFAPAFAKAGITLGIGTEITDILNDHGLRRALSLARLTVDPLDSLAWRTLLHLEAGVGPTLIQRVCDERAVGRFADRLMEVHSGGWEGIARSAKARSLVSKTLLWIDQSSRETISHWGQWLIELSGSTGVSEAVREVVMAIDEQALDGSTLQEYLNNLEPSIKDLLSSQSDGVRIMTMGMSKGLTVDTAIIVGVDGNTVPSSRGIQDEELRLLYVAMTRATHLTAVTFASRRTGPTARLGTAGVQEQREQSPFLIDLPGLPLMR